MGVEKIYIERGNRLNEVYKYLVKTNHVKTQKQFAETIGCTPGQISKAMKGNPKDMTPGLIRKVCSTFGGIFNEAYLLNGEGILLKEQDKEQHSIDTDQRTVEYSIYKEALDRIIELEKENALLRLQLLQYTDMEKQKAVVL